MLNDLFLQNPFLSLLQSLLFVYCSYLLGGMLLEALGASFPSHRARVAYATLAGYGTYGLLALALGLVGYLQQLPLLLVTLLVAFFRRTQIWANAKLLANVLRNPRALLPPPAVRSLDFGVWFLYAIIFVWLGSYLLISLVPVTAHDTLFYHLPIMQAVMHEDRIVFDGVAKHYGYLPILGEMIYSSSTVLLGQIKAPFTFEFVELSLLFIFLAIVHEFLRSRLHNRLLVPGALIMILSMMEMEREVFHFGYIDMPVFVFGLAAVFLVLEAYGRSTKITAGNAALAGVLIGMSIGIKYSGLYFLLFTGLFLAADLLRKKLDVHALRSIVVFGMCVFLAGGFWYVKNLRAFGNPVYPLYSYPDYNQGIGLFIVEKTFPNMITFPYHRWLKGYIAHPEKESSSTVLHFAYIIILALALFFAAVNRERERWRSEEVALVVFVFGYLWLLFFGSHQARFLVPTFMVLPVALVFFIESFYGYYKERFGQQMEQRLVSYSAVTGIVIALVLFGANVHYFKHRYDYAFGRINAFEYIRNVGSQ